MSEDFKYFRIKMSYKDEDERGAIVGLKSEDIVMASCYADAEKIAYELAEGKDQYGDVEFEILKTKIAEIDFNDTMCLDDNLTCGLVTYFFEESDNTEVGLYQVSLVYQTIDEKSGKIKNENSTIYVPAQTSSLAIDNTKAYLKNVGETREYTIRNVKYDKAQSILVTVEKSKSIESKL